MSALIEIVVVQNVLTDELYLALKFKAIGRIIIRSSVVIPFPCVTFDNVVGGFIKVTVHFW